MNAAKIILALTLLAGMMVTSCLAPTPSLAQSQPNYGPNSPGGAIPSASRIAALPPHAGNQVAGRLPFAVD
jgi:hypothetical protein